MSQHRVSERNNSSAANPSPAPSQRTSTRTMLPASSPAPNGRAPRPCTSPTRIPGWGHPELRPFEPYRSRETRAPRARSEADPTRDSGATPRIAGTMPAGQEWHGGPPRPSDHKHSEAEGTKGQQRKAGTPMSIKSPQKRRRSKVEQAEADSVFFRLPALTSYLKEALQALDKARRYCEACLPAYLHEIDQATGLLRSICEASDKRGQSLMGEISSKHERTDKAPGCRRRNRPTPG
jgi:hypothetical protein